MYVVLVYDICMDDKGAKVSRNIFKICKKYLSHIQNSVFEGELSKVQIKELNLELSKYIRKDKDSVILFKSRDERWLEKEFWGKDDDLTSIFL
ncbi:MAG: CRISPR-associated endonuclease Cas2 [Clostridia bacterium]|jgi:CRISPR-associated protein Cas2|nr:CRISPR-associated endonuclease Cas2 [Clostridia bacterium]MCI2001205.1 CRISPR-associated endonuclease Cas2 [Clostridia bacterium]MCI2015927.1 CRISPR-associated endonuclease Cas2 [Clostridia bacterium]